jgi:hypothetical protein
VVVRLDSTLVNGECDKGVQRVDTQAKAPVEAPVVARQILMLKKRATAWENLPIPQSQLLMVCSPSQLALGPLSTVAWPPGVGQNHAAVFSIVQLAHLGIPDNVFGAHQHSLGLETPSGSQDR